MQLRVEKLGGLLVRDDFELFWHHYKALMMICIDSVSSCDTSIQPPDDLLRNMHAGQVMGIYLKAARSAFKHILVASTSAHLILSQRHKYCCVS